MSLAYKILEKLAYWGQGGISQHSNLGSTRYNYSDYFEKPSMQHGAQRIAVRQEALENFKNLPQETRQALFRGAHSMPAPRGSYPGPSAMGGNNMPSTAHRPIGGLQPGQMPPAPAPAMPKSAAFLVKKALIAKLFREA